MPKRFTIGIWKDVDRAWSSRLRRKVGRPITFYLAHALNVDIISQGDDYLDALKNLRDCIQMQRRLGKNSPCDPAPKECWREAAQKGIILKDVKF